MREREDNRFDNAFVSNVAGTETASVVTPRENSQVRRSKEHDPREGLLNNLIDDMR